MKRKIEYLSAPENLGWLALYACIYKNISPADALKGIGIKVLHKSPNGNGRLLDDEEYQAMMGGVLR